MPKKPSEVKTDLPDSNPYARMWHLYCKRRACDDVIRSGFGLCGCYPYQTDYDQNAPHPESVSEHTIGTVYLVMLLASFCPWLFTRTHLAPHYDDEYVEVQLRAWRVAFLLMHHDVGEVIYGDRPDDGSQNVEEKDASETQYVQSFAQLFPRTQCQHLTQDFAQFQDPKNQFLVDNWTNLYGDLIELARLCDKFDAILKSIHYDVTNRSGNLQHKLEHFGSITAQDQRFIDMANGDSSVTAVWTAHIASDYHDYFGFYELMSIVREAVIETRGEWFPWWSDLCTAVHAPDYKW